MNPPQKQDRDAAKCFGIAFGALCMFCALGVFWVVANEPAGGMGKLGKFAMLLCGFAYGLFGATVVCGLLGLFSDREE